MNVKRYIAAALALFVFIFFYDWLVHGYFLSGLYEETSSIWRDMAEMSSPSHMALGFVEKLIIAFWVTFFFVQFRREGGTSNGLHFGFLLGVLCAVMMASWYLFIPIPATLAWTWFAVSFVQILVGGLIIGSIYHK